MKILYLSNSKIPSNTAYSVHVMKMCQALASNGHDVTLVGLKNSKDNNQKLFDIYNVRKIFKLSLVSIRLPKINSFLLLILSLIRSMKAEIIYSRWRIGAFLVGLLFRKKTIYFEYHIMPQSKINQFIESHLINKNKITKHIFITNALKNDYFKKYPILKSQNCIILPDGADVPQNNSKSFNLDTSNTLQICYVGSFFPGKGIDLVIELANSYTTAHFHIIGGKNSEVEKYKARVKSNNVTFYGYQNQNTISNLLRKMDIGLLPNQPRVSVGDKSNIDIGSWTSPMKMFDYMAHKNAIIASDLDVLKEVLINNYNAKIVDHSAINEWIRVINELNESREELKRIANNAFNDLVSKYTWNNRAKKVI